MSDFRIVRDWKELWTYRCPICPGTNRIVPGCGPHPARVFMVSEAPGENEDRLGRPFCGLAGHELDHTYLPLAGLDRYEVAIDNVRHCRPINNRKPSPSEIHECSSHFLPSEIEMVDPEFIVLMGASACSLVPEIDLEAHHGIPQWGRVFQWEGWVFSTYHPAAGLHETSMMIELLEDFENLRVMLEGRDPKEMQPRDLYPNPVYREIHAEELRRLLDWHDTSGEQRLGIDQENQDGEMISVQVSRMPGTGFLVRGDDWDSLKVLREGVASGGFTCFLHNSPQDMDWLETKAGIYIPSWCLRDTMQEAYALGNLPQGLKPLAYRLAGMRMRSYDDVVDGPSRQEVVRWLQEAQELDCVLPDILEVVPKPRSPSKKKSRTLNGEAEPSQDRSEGRRTRKRPGKTPKAPPKPKKPPKIRYQVTKNPIQTAIKRILGHSQEGPDLGAKPYNPWRAWEKEKEKWSNKLKESDEDDAPLWVRGKKDVDEAEKAEKALVVIGEVERRVGRMPSRGLRRVERGEALRYSCADPDSTLRVAEVMEARAALVGREIAEADL